MELTDFNELKRLMKEGDKLRGNAGAGGNSSDEDFEFETKNDTDSYLKNQIYSYANNS